MSQQVIGVGTNPNDGTGDQLRTAMQKVNANFTELYAADTTEASARAAADTAEATARANADTTEATTRGNADTAEANARAAADLVVHSQGHCELILSAGSLVLRRKGGNQVFINGAQKTIPSGGVSLAPGGLTPGTLYYIYLFDNSGTLTLEASTTVYVADTTYGHMIKTADVSRILVGAVVPVAGPAFSDTITSRLVRSWYNDSGVSIMTFLPGDTNMGAGPFVEIATSIRTNVLLWNGENVIVRGSGTVYDNSAGEPTMYLGIGRNGVNVGVNGATAVFTGRFSNISAGYANKETSEVNVQFTLMGGNSGGAAPRYTGGYTGYTINTSGNGG